MLGEPRSSARPRDPDSRSTRPALIDRICRTLQLPADAAPAITSSYNRPQRRRGLRRLRQLQIRMPRRRQAGDGRGAARSLSSVRPRRSCRITATAGSCARSMAWPRSTRSPAKSKRSWDEAFRVAARSGNSPTRRDLTFSARRSMSWTGMGMIEPYTAVGLIPSFWGIRRREDIEKNLEHLESLTKAAFWLSNLDIPVRLVAIPEGALQGFNDEVLDVDHAEFARTCAIDIPGPETDRPRAPRPQLGRVHHGAGQGAPRGLAGSVLQHRLCHRSGRRRHIETLQDLGAAAVRALGLAARPLRLVGREIRPHTCRRSGRSPTRRSAASGS